MKASIQFASFITLLLNDCKHAIALWLMLLALAAGRLGAQEEMQSSECLPCTQPVTINPPNACAPCTRSNYDRIRYFPPLSTFGSYGTPLAHLPTPSAGIPVCDPTLLEQSSAYGSQVGGPCSWHSARLAKGLQPTGQEHVEHPEWVSGSNVCNRSRWIAGFDALFLRSHFDQNVAMIIDPLPGNDLVPFNYDFNFSPRVVLGWLSPCNGGFRGSYWNHSDQADREAATAVVGATPVYLFVYGAGGNLTRNAYADIGDTLTSIHRVNLQSIDIEYFDVMQWSRWHLNVGTGIRLAKIDQFLRGDVYDSLGTLEEAVTNELQVLGAGPTASLMIQRQFVPSGWGGYAGLRGSLLFSETEQIIYEMKNSGADEVSDRAAHQEISTIAELSLGIQCTRCFSSGSLAFLRVGYELQSWQDVGGPVDSTSTLGLDGIACSTGVSF